MKSRFTYGMFAGFALACFVFFLFFLFFFPKAFRAVTAKNPDTYRSAVRPAPAPAEPYEPYTDGYNDIAYYEAPAYYANPTTAYVPNYMPRYHEPNGYDRHAYSKPYEYKPGNRPAPRYYNPMAAAPYQPAV